MFPFILQCSADAWAMLPLLKPYVDSKIPKRLFWFLNDSYDFELYITENKKNVPKRVEIT